MVRNLSRSGRGARAAPAVALLLACSVSACVSQPSGPALVTLGRAHAHFIRQPHVLPGRPILFGSMIVCLTTTGRVTVDTVRPVRGTPSFRIVEYGLRPSPFWKGGVAIGDLWG